MAKLHYGMCNFCDSACGLEIELEGDRILSIRGDKQNTFTRGHICPKGVAQQDLYNDPDRLRRPVRKKGDDWEEVSWDEALDCAGRGLAEVQKKYGRDALGVYWGNPVSHDYGALLCLLPFLKGLRTKNIYSANSVDSLARMLVSFLVYGNQAVIPIPDIERTDYMLIIGANPVISHGSVMTAPDCRKRLREIRERGGKIVVIDPRRTETAAIADRHYFIIPGSDSLFLFAFLDVLFKENLANPGGLGSKLEGLDLLRQCAAQFPPEKAAPAVGISADQIRTLAREFAAAPSAVGYGRMGISTQEFGSLATWLIDAINLVTGNAGKPGGAMFASPAVDLLWLSKLLSQPGFFNRWQSRVSGLPEFNGEFPVAALAEEMETPGPGQIKAMVILAGNPVLSLPNGAGLDRALAKLDYLVAIDFYISETARHADIILPPLSPLETDHYPILELSMGIRNHARYAPALFPRPQGSKPLWEIMTDLVNSVEKHSGVFSSIIGSMKRKVLYYFDPPSQLNLLLKYGPRKMSLRELKEHPHGIDLGPLQPGADKVICTKNGLIALVPPELAKDVERLQAKLDPARRLDQDQLLLVSRRTLRSINSWMHNSPTLVRGRNQCFLMMHPEDAKQRGVAPGQAVTVASRIGKIQVPVEISDEMMPGVVSMTFGWGHGRTGTRLSVASQHAGVSMNDIVDESLYDQVSGISVLDGIPVKVSASPG